MGGSSFRYFLPINVPKRYREQVYVFLWEILQSNRALLPWTRTVFLHNLHCGDHHCYHTGKRQSQWQLHQNPIQEGIAKKCVYLANGESSLAIFIADLGSIFWGDVRNVLALMRGKCLHKPTFAYDIVRIHSFMICTDLYSMTILETEKHLCSVAFLWEAKLWWYNIYRTMRELSNLQQTSV